jgi:hypothetical protein
MNRLALAQRTKLECGLAGAASLTDTVAPTGVDAKIVGWVDDAWKRIQQAKLWDFMWEAGTVTILANTAITAGTIAERRYIKDGCRNADSVLLEFMPWAQFRHAYPSGLIAAGTPSVWSIRPDKAFAVNAKPTSNTSLTAERYKAPTVMAANTDSPTGLDSELHMAIVWRAVMLYAGHDAHGALYQHADAEYRKLMATAGAQEQEAPHWGAGW